MRIGTAEIYRQVDQLPEILESIALDRTCRAAASTTFALCCSFGWSKASMLTEDKERIRTLRVTRPASFREKIIQVADIPRTISGKITELAVRDVVHGRGEERRRAGKPAGARMFRDLPELQN